jgi:hypothetical protein
MPAHIVSCNTQRRSSQQNFVVGHRHHLHHPISLLFLFVPVPALPHVHMHFVTLSLFFIILLSWSQLCFSPIHAGTKADGASDQAHSFVVTRSTFSFGRRTMLKRSVPSWHSNVLTPSVVFPCISYCILHIRDLTSRTHSLFFGHPDS